MTTEVHRSSVATGTSDLQFYYAQWKALDAYITALASRYTQQDFPRKSTVQYLLKGLQVFAAGQFNFFYRGFGGGDSKHPGSYLVLEPNEEFPPEYVLTAIIDQIGHDLEVIQRAADQRIMGDRHIQETLANADKLAWSAVKPAVDYAVVEEATTVLTYFHKAAEFYRIPYAQVAMIAIPFTCTSTDDHRDFLAIPHEAGHYIFRHSIDKAQHTRDDLLQSLEDKYQDYKGWIKGIFEETFADIYGCLIAGPVMALDIQELALATSEREFVNGDGKHPNPVLRPYVYADVLQNDKVYQLTKKSHCDWRPIGQELAALWDNTLVSRGGKSKFAIPRISESTDGSLVTIQRDHHEIETARHQGPLDATIKAVVDAILDQILKYIKDREPASQSGDWAGWSGKITDRIGDLYAEYKTNFVHLLAKVKLLPPEADPDSVPDGAEDQDGTTQLWRDWVKDKLKDGWPPKEPMGSGELKDPDKMTKGTWGYVLRADGWTTGGPDNDAGHLI